MRSFVACLLHARKWWLGIFFALALVLGAWWAAAHYLGRSYVNVALGCMPVDGVAEAGFHYQEFEAQTPFRWTNGFARLLVPIDARRPPQRLWVSIENLRPQPTPVHLQVLVDEKTLFDGLVGPGMWQKFFDLGSHRFFAQTLIELRSDVFRPKGVMDGGKNTDPRVLGVKVHGIMLVRDQR